MITLYFDNYENFAIDIADRYDEVKKTDGFDSIDIIAKYEDAKEIIRELITIGYGIAFINNFSDSEWDGYEDEFVISLYNNEIWCEAAKRDGRYITSQAKVAYLLDNCNSKIIPMIEADEIYEVEIGEDDCDGECENCECKPSTATYKVNGEEVSKSAYENKMAELNSVFRKHMDTVLGDYSSFIEDMTKWKKLLKW